MMEFFYTWAYEADSDGFNGWGAEPAAMATGQHRAHAYDNPELAAPKVATSYHFFDLANSLSSRPRRRTQCRA